MRKIINSDKLWKYVVDKDLRHNPNFFNLEYFLTDSTEELRKYNNWREYYKLAISELNRTCIDKNELSKLNFEVRFRMLHGFAESKLKNVYFDGKYHLLMSDLFSLYITKNYHFKIRTSGEKLVKYIFIILLKCFNFSIDINTINLCS